MADGVNKAILIGNLGQDPELRYTGSGTSVCNMRVATNKTWTNDAGEEQSRTEWHTVTAWGRMGEVCNEYLEKGSQAYFEGELQTREWEDRDGNNRYSTEVKAHEVQFLGGGGDGTPGGPPPRGKSESSGDGQAQDDPDEKFEPDDHLPF